MGQEIELKLSIDAADVESFLRHPFLSRYAAGTDVIKHLANCYYDTSDQILRKHNMALRVRFDGEKYIQTLKKKGTENSGGLSVRGEWEWVLPGPAIDLERIQPEIWPEAVTDRLERLVQVFRTDFDRRMWRLDIPVEGRPSAVVEMSLDQGEVVAGADRTELLEVELELLEGDMDVLFRISKTIGETIRFKPDTISKAEKGYRLLDMAVH